MTETKAGNVDAMAIVMRLPEFLTKGLKAIRTTRTGLVWF